MQKQDKFGD